ncbi:PAS domain S-box protein [Halobaculum sp. MBLA0147]|uniref:PAS domain-containing sensor histidine kinase n=1 Tax=Halobaculum sp. MBLA0147 TaxID=3079934 RepID=UPI003523FD88
MADHTDDTESPREPPSSGGDSVGYEFSRGAGPDLTGSVVSDPDVAVDPEREYGEPGTELPEDALPDAYRATFRHTNDAVFVVDVANDAVVDCNAAATDLVGFSRRELLSMPASDLHPHNFEEFREFADTVQAEGSATTDEITCYCRGGTILPATMSATVIEVDGRPHLLNHVRDRVDDTARAYHEALTAHSRDLVTVLARDGTVRYQGPSVESVLGLDPETLRSQPYLERVHHDDRSRVAELLEVAVHADNPATDRVEYRFGTADGSWVWLESAASHRPDSPVEGIVLNSREVTARKENQQQAGVLHRVLRHNLRNELTKILGFAETLRDADDESTASAADRIYQSAGRLESVTSYARLLNDIFESHRVEQRCHELDAIVRDTVADLEPEFPSATVDVDIRTDRPVDAAPRIDVAVEQLVENALEHAGDEPRVAVRLLPDEYDDSRLRLVVVDDGPGIPAQERQTLLEGEEQPLQHGSGLGLWLVNWIVTRSGGRITFGESDLGGSRVAVSLSVADENTTV